MIGFGIIGCGLIGQKRASAIRAAGGHVNGCADLDISRAESVSKNSKAALATADYHELLKRDDIQAVIVATLHNVLPEITEAALKAGKHVLVEKPAARFASELKPLHELAISQNLKVRIGFNHRFHRAFQKARTLVDDGAIGELMFLRARYGHGGRVGYDKEWRADPQLSGGGEMIDQGVHLIDLSRWFLGDFTEIGGYAHTYYWNMPVDDNAFMMLRTASNQMAWLHASCSEWKNTFSMEIYGRAGKLQIDGLGGSYGVEKLTFYDMQPEMGPPPTTVWEYPMADDSWEQEVRAFITDIETNREPNPNLLDAIATLAIVEKIAKDSGYDYHP